MNGFYLVLFLVVAVGAQKQPLSAETATFEDFKQRFRLTFSSEEEGMRKELFLKEKVCVL